MKLTVKFSLPYAGLGRLCPVNVACSLNIIINTCNRFDHLFKPTYILSICLKVAFILFIPLH